MRRRSFVFVVLEAAPTGAASRRFGRVALPWSV